MTIVSTKLVDVTCWCGIVYAIPAPLSVEAQRTVDEGRKGLNVYCPLGHSWVYNVSDEVKRLKDELTRTRSKLDQEQARADANFALLDKAERKIKRVQKGTCPHCRRHFVNVARHMKTKHGATTP